MSETIVIYGLYRPGRDIFYIGRTNNLKRRLKEHRRLFKGGIDAIVLEVVDISQWRAAEHAWIKEFRDAGVTIANRTEGGDGIETLRADIKAAISARFKGKPQSLESRRKRSLAMKGRKKNWSSEGAERVRETQIKPGTKPWNTFTPDMTEDEKEEIRQRIRASQSPEMLAKLAVITKEQSRRTWSEYTVEEHAARCRKLMVPKRQRKSLSH